MAQCPIVEGYEIGSGFGLSSSLSSQVFGAGASINNTDIVVDGTFTIDAGLKINNCRIYMGTDARIRVQTGSLVAFVRDTIEGCGSLWHSVDLRPGTTNFSMLNSVVKHGLYALTFQDGSSAYLSDNLFLDNYIGVFSPELPAGSPAKTFGHSIVRNRFEGTSNSSLPPYTGSDTPALTPTAKPYAGIFIFDATDFSVGTGACQALDNRFFNLSIGLATERVLHVVVRNAQFRKMRDTGTNLTKGYGIRALAYTAFLQEGINCFNSTAMTFQNCDVGISGQGGSFESGQNNIRNVDGAIEVEVEDAPLSIHDNNVEDTYLAFDITPRQRASISVTGNQVISENAGMWISGALGRPSVLIRDNDITNGNLGSPPGTYAVFLNLSFSNAQITVLDNNIRFANNRYGIMVVNPSSSGLAIHGNTIDFSGDPSAKSGIEIVNGNPNAFSTHSIQYNFIHSGGTEEVGIRVFGTPAIAFLCNDIQDVAYGVRFGGACTSTLLRSTNFWGSGKTGLLLDANAVISPQYDVIGGGLVGNGNQWFSPTYSDVAARNYNISGANFSQFLVPAQPPSPPANSYFPNNGGIKSVFPPSATPSDPDDWFYEHPEVDGGIGCVLWAPLPPGEAGIMADHYAALLGWAANEPLSATTWQYQKQGLAQLGMHPEYAAYVPALGGIQEALANGPVGVSLAVEQGLGRLATTGASFGPASEAQWDMAAELSAQTQVLDSLLALATDSTAIGSLIAEKEALAAAWPGIASVLSAIRADVQDSIATLASALLVLNAGLQGDALFVQNERAAMHFLLSALAVGDMDVLLPHLPALGLIAEQCPEEGGEGVFIARSLLYHWMPAHSFGEDCGRLVPIDAAIGNAAEHLDDERRAAVRTAIAISPNPSASGLFDLYVPRGISRLSVCDLAGRSIVADAAASGTTYALDLATQAPGVYLLRLEDGDGRESVHKLVKY